MKTRQQCIDEAIATRNCRVQGDKDRISAYWVYFRSPNNRPVVVALMLNGEDDFVATVRENGQIVHLPGFRWVTFGRFLWLYGPDGSMGEWDSEVPEWAGGGRG